MNVTMFSSMVFELGKIGLIAGAIIGITAFVIRKIKGAALSPQISSGIADIGKITDVNRLKKFLDYYAKNGNSKNVEIVAKRILEFDYKDVQTAKTLIKHIPLHRKFNEKDKMYLDVAMDEFNSKSWVGKQDEILTLWLKAVYHYHTGDTDVSNKIRSEVYSLLSFFDKEYPKHANLLNH